MLPTNYEHLLGATDKIWVLADLYPIGHPETPLKSFLCEQRAGLMQSAVCVVSIGC